MKKAALVFFLLSFLVFCGKFRSENANSASRTSVRDCTSNYGLYVFSYGKSSYPNRFLNSDEEDGNREIVYLFYLIRIPGKNILVDSGFVNDSYKTKFGFVFFERPDLLLKKCGLEPKKVSDIVLTHFHFDHAGGIFLFPSANVHIQNHDLDLFKKQSYFADQHGYLNKLRTLNRLHSFDGTYSLNPSMQILFTGGHTPGSQALEWVASSENQFLITGDECYLIQECKNGIGLPKSAAFSIKRNRDFLDYIQILNGKGTKILTLHDPSILQQGEEIAPGVRLLFSL